MKKNRVLKIIFSFACFFMIFSSSFVFASESLETAIAPGKPGNPDIGKITLYSDYKIEFDYEYRVKDIKIWVCKDQACLQDNPQIEPNQTYLGNSVIEFSIKDYLIKEDEDVTYTIKAIGNFKYQETDYNESFATLNYEVTLKGEYNDSSGRDDDIFDNSENAMYVVNHWIIPGMYIIIGILFIIKSILLCIDLVKYSDNSEVRKEKLRGFVYIFVGLLAVAVITSTVGVITGLFKF